MFRKIFRSKLFWLALGAIGIFVVGGKPKEMAEKAASKVGLK